MLSSPQIFLHFQSASLASYFRQIKIPESHLTIAYEWGSTLSILENYRDQSFTVADSEARIRDGADLSAFLRWSANEARPAGVASGEFKLVPKGAKVAVTEVRIVPSSSKDSTVYAKVELASDRMQLGWTSTRNFAGKFRNVTLGEIRPAAGAGKYSSTAAWRGGNYLRQVSLIRIVDRTLDIEFITEDVAGPYQEMVKAAAQAGIEILLNSGFRTYAEQKHLHDGYVARRPGFNLAAAPGKSNHQNGIAIDIDTAGGVGSPVYDWLAQEAPRFGFIRTVKTEAWHWEWRPDAAKTARAAGKHVLW